eukprot:3331762-Lingulodinium_polyedra.AAC.1
MVIEAVIAIITDCISNRRRTRHCHHRRPSLTSSSGPSSSSSPSVLSIVIVAILIIGVLSHFGSKTLLRPLSPSHGQAGQKRWSRCVEQGRGGREAGALVREGRLGQNADQQGRREAQGRFLASLDPQALRGEDEVVQERLERGEGGVHHAPLGGQDRGLHVLQTLEAHHPRERRTD